MKRTVASRIDWTMLTQGEVYRVKVPALGEVLARLLDKEKLIFEITEGKLQSQADRNKRWTKGDCFEVTPGFGEFWEVQ